MSKENIKTYMDSPQEDVGKNPSGDKKLQKKNKYFIGHHILLILIVFFVVAPFSIPLATSFQSEFEANEAVFHLIPKEFSWQAYHDVLFKKMAGTSVLRGLFNTLWIYLPGIIVGLLSSSMAAYAFAKLEFRLKNFMFSVLLGTMMLPNCMSTIASYLLFDTINWINTPWPLMIPRMFGSISIVFFLKQYYAGIPDDIMGAAKIDGLGIVGIFFKIMLGLAKPAIFAQFILSFIGAYNDYMGPLLYLQDASMYTLQISLAFFAGVYTQNWPLRMAATVVSMLPLIIMYLFSQRYILKGLEIAVSLKG
jgi:multiple sugar transport system permease protein